MKRLQGLYFFGELLLKARTEDQTGPATTKTRCRRHRYRQGKIHCRQREAIVAITGAGWPSHAAITHQYHENYARRTLYAYLRCPALTGVDYVHEMVERYYDNSFAKALEHFVSEENHWCPPWIRRNYEQKNSQTDRKQSEPEDRKLEKKITAEAGKDVDKEIGKLIDDLENEGLLDNTIIFYYFTFIFSQNIMTWITSW